MVGLHACICEGLCNILQFRNKGITSCGMDTLYNIIKSINYDSLTCVHEIGFPYHFIIISRYFGHMEEELRIAGFAVDDEDDSDPPHAACGYRDQ